MSNQRKAFLYTVLAAFFWGSSFTVVKVGLDYIDPYLFVLLRFAIASGILFALCVVFRARCQIQEVIKDPYVVLLGVINALAFGFQFRGQVEASAASATMIINSSAVLVAPLAIVFLREGVTRSQLLALPIGMLGVYFIVWHGGKLCSSGSRIVGDVMVLLSALLYAFYIVITRLIMTRRRYSSIDLVTGVFLWSLPIFVLGLFLLGESQSFPLRGLVLSAYLAIFCSIIPFILWADAIRHISALTSAIALLSELVFGVVVAMVLLGEELTHKSLAGCLLISCALLMLSRSESANHRL